MNISVKLSSFLAGNLLAAIVFSTAHAAPLHGIAMHGEPALPADFKNLPYANPDAPQGGALRLAITGTFDSTSPFIVKGTAATGIRTYVFESLMGRNWDEAFSLYGLLAESIDASDDRQTFTFKIRPEAKFSDGKPVTAEDVVFSMETLRDKGRPNYKSSYSKVTEVETPDDHTVVFHQDAGDRELPLIMGVMPILPKHAWDGKAFDESSLALLVGSGPYLIGEVKAGESITYKKNPDIGARTFRSARACGTSTACVTTITGTPMQPSKPSRRARRISGPRAIPHGGPPDMIFRPSRKAS